MTDASQHQDTVERIRSEFPDFIDETDMFMADWVDTDHYLETNLLQLREIIKAYQEEDYESYVWHHMDGYKPYALVRICDEGRIVDKEYWDLVRGIWIMQQAPGFAHDAWYYLLTDDTPPGLRSALEPDELEVFDSLPEFVTAYRGARADNNRGLSWTLDLEMAKFFAAYRTTEGQVWQVTVPRSNVLAYVSSRSESELIIKLNDETPVELYNSSTLGKAQNNA